MPMAGDICCYRLAMRWIVMVAGTLLGLAGGLALNTRAIVVLDVAAPLAPEMTLQRFMQCSEVQAADFDQILAQWRERQWRGT